ncbi:hypothetical protein NDU88_001924 [Pleurodeles waltl]|uniref:Uncharacterized protein n=1 Tax=Pleurodeles waltl TaxID=8319 RepID=A0AAV7MLQ7_PLEWA|nr:hypothetical protein NDU88_001924 [Pleurodeles waltl]
MRGRLTYWKAASRAPDTSPPSGAPGTWAGVDTRRGQSSVANPSKLTAAAVESSSLLGAVDLCRGSKQELTGGSKVEEIWR